MGIIKPGFRLAVEQRDRLDGEGPDDAAAIVLPEGGLPVALAPAEVAPPDVVPNGAALAAVPANGAAEAPPGPQARSTLKKPRIPAEYQTAPSLQRVLGEVAAEKAAGKARAAAGGPEDGIDAAKSRRLFGMWLVLALVAIVAGIVVLFVVTRDPEPRVPTATTTTADATEPQRPTTAIATATAVVAPNVTTSNDPVTTGSATTATVTTTDRTSTGTQKSAKPTSSGEATATTAKTATTVKSVPSASSSGGLYYDED